MATAAMMSRYCHDTRVAQICGKHMQLRRRRAGGRAARQTMEKDPRTV
jgi:hypothetical protein